MKTRIIAVLTAALLLAASIGFAFPAAASFDGYCAEDVVKLRAFLETADSEGVTNGSKLLAGYDPADPATWGEEIFHEEGEWIEIVGAEWVEVEGVMHLGSLFIENRGLVGELDVSGCAALTRLSLQGNRLTSVRAEGCGELWYLNCSDNGLYALDITDCVSLSLLFCEGNLIAELDLCPLSFETVLAVGGGAVSFDLMTGRVAAIPAGDVSFLGWYSADGAYITASEELSASDTDSEAVAAHFVPVRYLPGDADGNGVVDISDALSVLRCALGLVSLTPGLAAVCDVDANGSLNAADALIILRLALGL